MSKIQKHPPPKSIAIDVDGTLVQKGEPNKRLIAWMRERKAEGYSLTLWSSRGEAYAREVATLLKITDLFDHILSKPGYIVDDMGWTWIKFTRVVRLLSEKL